MRIDNTPSEAGCPANITADATEDSNTTATGDFNVNCTENVDTDIVDNYN